MLQWFGTDWGSPVNQETEHIPTPIGEDCVWCGEPIVEGDNGFCMAHLKPFAGLPMFAMAFSLEHGYFHFECHMRGIVGGANHQLGLCACFGGSEPSDPPGLSRRDQARRAMEVHNKAAAARWN